MPLFELGAAAGSSLRTASGFVLYLETVDQYDVTSLLGGLASVEVAPSVVKQQNQ